MKQEFGELVDYLDKKSMTAKADTYFMEMAALSNKVNRLEKWIEEIVSKVGMKLK